MHELLADTVVFRTRTLESCHTDDRRGSRDIDGVYIGIHENNAVQRQVVTVEEETVPDSRKLKHQVDAVRLGRNIFTALMLLDVVKTDILPAKEIHTAGSSPISLVMVIHDTVDVETRHEGKLRKIPGADQRQQLSLDI